jgi:excisionase family DNA binding protein
MNKLLDTAEAGRLLGVSAAYVRGLINSGQLRAARIGEKRFRLEEMELERYCGRLFQRRVSQREVDREERLAREVFGE